MREIPAVHRLLEHPLLAPYESLVGRASVRESIDRELARARAGNGGDLDALAQRIAASLDAHAACEMQPVINATGTLLHTNLGRAPLGRDLYARAAAIACGSSNLEFDLTAGTRGSRYEHASRLICELTGAQDALVVNNCAAAVLLALDTLAKGCEVVAARGELVEIGGGFRIPDVLARSGARLVEVGSTNKTYLADFEGALRPATALLMRTHRANFEMTGFVQSVSARDLATLARRCGVNAIEDLGSGALCDLRAYGLPYERTVRDALDDGMGLVAFSGDKLVGGPQAGILAGSRSLVARLRSNPLLRALRVDKVTLALLTETLRLHRSEQSRASIPLYAMLAMTRDELRARASRYVDRVVGLGVEECAGRVGGGTLPNADIASFAVVAPTTRPDAVAARLRAHATPIVARVRDDAVLLDLRTIDPSDDGEVIDALSAVVP